VQQAKIEFWYQILAFYEIAGMIDLGACPLVFENSKQPLPGFRAGPRIVLFTPQRLLSNPPPPFQTDPFSKGKAFHYSSNTPRRSVFLQLSTDYRVLSTAFPCFSCRLSTTASRSAGTFRFSCSASWRGTETICCPRRAARRPNSPRWTISIAPTP